MSIFVDTLAEMVSSSLDSDATREDWERALDLVFDPPEPLNPLEDRDEDTDWSVTWAIDTFEQPNAASAAVWTWQELFNRGLQQPSNEESCIFIVTDRNTGRSTEVDLSDE